MPDDATGSVTHWIADLRAGDPHTVENLKLTRMRWEEER